MIDAITNNKFISDIIKTWILNSNLSHNVYKNNYINVRIYWNPDNNLYSENVMKYIIDICNFMRLYANYKNKITCYIFLSPYKKILPDNYNLTYNDLTCNEINSGASVRGEYVCIWRYEELYKVLFHELIHCYGLDVKANYNKLKKFSKLHFNIHGNESLQEAYTESLAIILHTLYFSDKSDFIKNLNREIKFIKFQAEKINSICNLCIKEYRYSNTSIFSYYILKYAFLSDINKFLNFVNENNMSLNDMTDEYIKYITKSFNRLKLNPWIKSNVNMLDKTLRMSSFDIS